MSTVIHTPSSASTLAVVSPTPAAPNPAFLAGLALLAALGCVGISPALIILWDLWTNDPLRSIGAVIVAASIVLTVRVWRQMSWEMHGTWWGLAPLALAFLTGDLRLKLAWFLVVGPFRFNFIAPKLALYLLGCGIVLLFGGWRVWRRAWFALALLICSQPMPLICSRYVDLPLQNLSAQVARSFAVHIGFAPSDHELLRLMFTPNFGMFIAPGCDGLRGALTLGYAALIVGYLRRVSFIRWIAWVAGAVFLGYLLNLVRLCALVLYYRAALGHPALENWAAQADYAIGGCIILLAVVFSLWIVLRHGGNQATAELLPAPSA